MSAISAPPAVPGGAKRKADEEAVNESDLMKLTPLGAGQEVGRSCMLLEFKGKTIMFDCGVHPAHTGIVSLPFFDETDLATVDLLLVTHFHLDHCAALPYLLSKTKFKGRVFMTQPTRSIYKWMLHDYVKVSNIHTSDNILYTEKDIEASMSKIETIDYHQDLEIDGVKFRAYPAGHVLGACMFFVEISGVKVLYTGDYSCEEERHLIPASIPEVKPDILVIESTYGVQSHESRIERETRFTGTIHEIVSRGGRCLIPTFALGRAQELLLILDEYWANHPELHSIPIYYGSSLAQKCMKIYQGFINQMNSRIRAQFSSGSNPFSFAHISTLRSVRELDDVGPSVVLASPGFMQNGPSRELFDMWCSDRKNGVILAGYTVEGTLAHQIRSEPKEVQTLAGKVVKMCMSVHYISFSAHADYKQTSNFIDKLRSPHVILVHGKQKEMDRLKENLDRKYQDSRDYALTIYTPPNLHVISFHFRGEKMAKAIGKLAENTPQDKLIVRGLLVKKGFTHSLVTESELSTHTELTTSEITQKLCVSFNAEFSLLEFHLAKMFGEVIGCDTKTGRELWVYEQIHVTQHSPTAVLLTWKANAFNDMIADSVLAVVLQADASPASVKLSSEGGHSHGESEDEHAHHDHSEGLQTDLQYYLGKHFERVIPTKIEGSGGGAMLTIHCDGKTATVDSQGHVQASDEAFRGRVGSTVLKIKTAFDSKVVLESK